MATLKIEAAGGAQTLTETRTISGGNMTRFYNAVKVHFGMPAGTTDAQAHTRWARDVLDQARVLALNVERAAAAKTASDGVDDIPLT